MKIKIIRTSTIPLSLDILLKGQLSFLSKKYEVVALSSNDENLKIVGQRECIRTISVEMKRKISILQDLKSFYHLYKVFKREKPVIVHSITPKAGLLSMLAAKLARIPIRIHTFTGLIFPTKTGGMQKLLIYMDKLLCWAATNIYPEGNGVKNDLSKFNITSKPLKVLANGNVNGIDVDFFSPQKISNENKVKLRNALNINENDFVFIFVGRLVGDKGINELITAFKKLLASTNNNIESKLLLVGSLEIEFDPLLPEVLKEIQNNHNIISVGFQKDVRPYFAISNALVFPSYREGFPNVVIQAGAMGLPSIVSDINGCNEIIRQDENGMIIPSKNTESIFNSMLRLTSDKDYYKKLSQKSRLLITTRYEQSVVWNALLEEYDFLLKEKGYVV
ncbi:glycosyltransferase family 4 protein [uncultured Chryseobacterium sp.]|uniref:glycosyltransferase family 4 protein n=1 Tax=uncultured Chryseobacterium sp. TaxID=259322 RepID=UPI0025D1C7F8|nr:glycosyltransferase family 4 protein [uncultured Chryseobacterium sp.]